MKGTSRFRSKFEAAVAASLKERGAAFNYEAVVLPYVIQSIYTPDFILPNGVIVETKGVFDSDDRRKMVAVRDAHPDLDIRLCFQRASVRLARTPRSLTYWQWAERNGFLWCEGTIPTSWLTDAIQVPAA